MIPIFHNAFGNFQLQRRPPAKDQPLYAWDATDEYLLEEISLQSQHTESTLIVNDQFGALAIALNALQPHSWSDSCTAHLALADNCRLNHLINNAVIIPSTTMPPSIYSAVLWRTPKSIALLQQQIAVLRTVIDANTLIFAGGMIKHLPDQTPDMLGQLGAVEFLPAKKKARLFRIIPNLDLAPPQVPAEKLLSVPEYSLQLSGDANVFAREKLDIGARFFLEQFSQLPHAQSIADLGCGNGVLGIVAQRLQPEAELFFFDESYQAIASAESNYRRNIDADKTPDANFYCDDCLSHYQGEPLDLILCNPPFHQSHAVGDQIAWRMFTQSRQHLRSGGELWIVGNRHLNYHIKLKRIFGNCRQIAANPKFVVLAAKKSSLHKQ